MALGPTTVYPLAAPIVVGEGVPRVIRVTNPGAGNEVAQTVPGEGAWYIQSLIGTFTASAAVANRVPSLSITDGNVEIFRAALSGNIVATTVLTISGAVGLSPAVTAVTGGVANIGLPFLVLQPGYVIRTVTAAIDAGDTYTNVRLNVFELPYGPTGYVRGPALIDVPDYATGG